ncbi:MAG: hypothetical protein JWN85_1408 [Gammaproteobacteria bacterium]|nr:hypothetical protein [Gammaproteobacteria bacterium]
MRRAIALIDSEAPPELFKLKLTGFVPWPFEPDLSHPRAAHCQNDQRRQPQFQAGCVMSVVQFSLGERKFCRSRKQSFGRK